MPFSSRARGTGSTSELQCMSGLFGRTKLQSRNTILKWFKMEESISLSEEDFAVA